MTKKARGHDLAFRFAGSAAPVALKSFGEREFDNLVLLAQSLSGDAGKGGQKAVTVADVMEFIEDGGEAGDRCRSPVLLFVFVPLRLLLLYFFEKAVSFHFVSSGCGVSAAGVALVGP